MGYDGGGATTVIQSAPSYGFDGGSTTFVESQPSYGFGGTDAFNSTTVVDSGPFGYDGVAHDPHYGNNSSVTVS